MRRAALLLAALAGGCGGSDDAAPQPAYDQASDPRIAPLFEGCARSDFYDRALSDLVPIQVEKLEKSAIEPLKRAKEELAEAGARAIPELRRFVERHYSDPLAAPLLTNALDVLQRNPAPEARELVLRLLRHPSDTVRHGAVLALQLTHARPEDFDLLLEHLAVEIPERRHQVAIALFSADPARAEDLYLDWIEEGGRESLVPYVARTLSTSRRPETARRAAELYPKVRVDLRPLIAAPAARAGDADALAYVEQALAGTKGPTGAGERRNAVQAAVDAELDALLPGVLRSDLPPDVRAIAVGGLAARETLDEEALDALRYGLGDLAPAVRGACLDALVARGDQVAIDQALEMLDGTAAGLQEAMTALRPRLSEDPALAARVLERLAARNELEAFLPPAKRAGLLKAIGQVPGAAAARILRETGLAHAGVEIEGLPAHEWLMIQAANTGDQGRAYLFDQLASETDPLRRVDLLWAASAERSDATRERLLALIEGDSLSAAETLLVADRLARLGPAEVVAPRLKRVPPRVEDLRVRVALQCLLWAWY